MHLRYEKPVRVELACGDLLCLDGSSGAITMGKFDDSKLFRDWYYHPYSVGYPSQCDPAFDEEYLEELKSVASAFGYSPDDIDFLRSQGFTTDELEEMLYCGEL